MNFCASTSLTVTPPAILSVLLGIEGLVGEVLESCRVRRRGCRPSRTSIFVRSWLANARAAVGVMVGPGKWGAAARA